MFINNDYKEYIVFTINETKEMAIFLTTLTKEGIRYGVSKYGENYHILILGF